MNFKINLLDFKILQPTDVHVHDGQRKEEVIYGLSAFIAALL